MAGGMERVLTLKANYFADVLGYDITIILTEGEGQPYFYPLSDRIKVVNLNIGFEALWNQPILKKIFIYLKKQRQYKKALKAALMQIRPDITVSMLRREINFLNSIPDGSKKIGEIHINRAHYRTFEEGDSNIFKSLLSLYWKHTLVRHLRQLDSFVALTKKDQEAWTELDNVAVIPNPVSFPTVKLSQQTEKRVIAVGRYCHEKGYDHLLKIWSEVQRRCPDWRLDVFGDGDRTAFERLLDTCQIDRSRCALNGRVSDVQSEFACSSLAVCSSRFEGFGLAIVEAMACGLPVISFDCPWGPRSIIADGEDGVLVENGNLEQFAAAMVKLMQEADVRTEMGKRAAVNVQRFSMEAVARQWKDLFDSLQQK
jgi:glycosyltransferase involved in cell wall biosynthesis